MDPAHRREAIAARERPAQPRVDLRLIGPLMCDEVLRDDAVCFADQFRASRGSAELRAPTMSRSRSRLASSFICSSRNAFASLAGRLARLQLRPEPSARRALRMTATSMASCVSAPAIGVATKGGGDHG